MLILKNGFLLVDLDKKWSTGQLIGAAIGSIAAFGILAILILLWLYCKVCKIVLASSYSLVEKVFFKKEQRKKGDVQNLQEAISLCECEHLHADEHLHHEWNRDNLSNCHS